MIRIHYIYIYKPIVIYSAMFSFIFNEFSKNPKDKLLTLYIV